MEGPLSTGPTPSSFYSLDCRTLSLHNLHVELLLLLVVHDLPSVCQHPAEVARKRHLSRCLYRLCHGAGWILELGLVLTVTKCKYCWPKPKYCLVYTIILKIYYFVWAYFVFNLTNSIKLQFIFSQQKTLTRSRYLISWTLRVVISRVQQNMLRNIIEQGFTIS